RQRCPKMCVVRALPVIRIKLEWPPDTIRQLLIFLEQLIKRWQTGQDDTGLQFSIENLKKISRRPHRGVTAALQHVLALVKDDELRLPLIGCFDQSLSRRHRVLKAPGAHANTAQASIWQGSCRQMFGTHHRDHALRSD